jgi:hypothetical protein
VILIDTNTDGTLSVRLRSAMELFGDGDVRAGHARQWIGRRAPRNSGFLNTSSSAPP